MRSLILGLVMMFIPVVCYGQACDSTVDGHSRCNLDLVEYSGIPTPSVSPSGKGRMYFDDSSNDFQCSEDGGAYEACVGGGGVSTSIYHPFSPTMILFGE